jgi:hypothetical protein
MLTELTSMVAAPRPTMVVPEASSARPIAALAAMMFVVLDQLPTRGAAVSFTVVVWMCCAGAGSVSCLLLRCCVGKGRAEEARVSTGCHGV